MLHHLIPSSLITCVILRATVDMLSETRCIWGFYLADNKPSVHIPKTCAFTAKFKHWLVYMTPFVHRCVTSRMHCLPSKCHLTLFASKDELCPFRALAPSDQICYNICTSEGVPYGDRRDFIAVQGTPLSSSLASAAAAETVLDLIGHPRPWMRTSEMQVSTVTS